MFTKLKVKALKLMFKYHHYVGDFYLNRINKSGTDMNSQYWDKLMFHCKKEGEYIGKLYAIGGI